MRDKCLPMSFDRFKALTGYSYSEKKIYDEYLEYVEWLTKKYKRFEEALVFEYKINNVR